MDEKEVVKEKVSMLPKRYRHLKCGEDMSCCMHCGAKLEYRESRRVVPEPCEECKNLKLNKMMVDGKEVDIPDGYGSKFIEKANEELAKRCQEGLK